MSPLISSESINACAHYPQRFLMQKSRAERLVIGWQAAAPVFQPVANRLPRDVRVGKTLWIDNALYS